MRTRFIVYLLVVILVALLSIFLYRNYGSNANDQFISSVSYYGSIASVVGIIITVVELYHTETIAKSSAKEVKKKMESMAKMEIRSLLSSSIGVCDLIRSTLEHSDVGEAILFSRKLIDGLSVIKGERNMWISGEERDKLKQHFVRIRMDVDTLLRVKERGVDYDRPKTINTLDNVRDLLFQLEQNMINSDRNGQ